MFHPSLNPMQPLQNKLRSCLLTAATADMPSILLHWIFSFLAFAFGKIIFYYIVDTFPIFFRDGSIIYYKMDHLAQWAAAHMGPMGR